VARLIEFYVVEIFIFHGVQTDEDKYWCLKTHWLSQVENLYVDQQMLQRMYSNFLLYISKQ